MNPRAWRRAKALFEGMASLDATAREAALAAAEQDDPEVAAEVRSLLAQMTVGFIETPALGEGFSLSGADPPRAGASTTVERPDGYELIGVIGAGGMGTVYEAVQHGTNRRVAIKMLPAALTHRPEARQRFEREAETLGRLRHPCIATVFDAGRTDSGTPFVVMELVDGRPLTHWARESNPSRVQRLRTFEKVCAAVHAAHQRGVIHRDLKPSNILVDDEGRPKVLDFGLARFTDADHDGDGTHAALATEAGRLLGTLAYMAPEQARADPHAIEIRTDVYALGLLLYELMTGALPYAVSSDDLAGALRSICETPPRRPSALDRSLRGDLDTILLTALEKDVDRRYASAATLGEDVRRHIEHEPILARPPSLVYQFRKLVRRHTLPAGLAAALLVAVIGFGVVAGVQAIRLGRANAISGQQLYENQIARASLLYDQANLTGMKSVLEACAPERRRWEWDWLWSRTDPSQLTVSRAPSPIRTAGLIDGALATVVLDGFALELEGFREGQARRFEGHTALAPVVEIGPHGRRLASGDAEGCVILWDATDGSLLRRTEPLGESVAAICFDAAGERVFASFGDPYASGPKRGPLIGWRVEDGAEFLRSAAQVSSRLALDDEQRQIFAGASSRFIEYVDIRSGNVRRREMPEETRDLVALSRDIVFVATDRSVRRMTLSSGFARIESPFAATDFRSVALNGDRSLQAVGADRLLVVRDAQSLTELLRVPAHRQPAWRSRFLPSSAGTEWLLTWGVDGTARVWAVPAPFGADQARLIGALPDQEAIALFTEDGAVELRPTNGGGSVRRWRLPEDCGHALCAALGPQAEQLLIGTEFGAVLTADLAASGAATVSMPAGAGGHEVGVVALAALGAGFVSGSTDGRLLFSSGGAPRVLQENGAAIEALLVGPDAGIVAGAADGTVRRWRDVDAARDVYGPHEGAVLGICGLPGGGFVTTGTDGTARIWTADPATAPVVLPHEGFVFAATATPDGSRIVTASSDRGLRVWDPTVPVALLDLRWSFADAIWMDADGRRLTAVAKTGEVRTWDVDDRPADEVLREVEKTAEREE